jgi:hypothetical protein
LLPNLAGFLCAKDRSTLRHVFEPDLLLDLLVTVFTVPLSKRMFRAGTMELGVASRTLGRWGGEGFAACWAFLHIVTSNHDQPLVKSFLLIT